MSMDMSKLAKQLLSQRPAENAIATMARSLMQKEHEDLFKSIDPMHGIRSFIEEYKDYERRTLRDYQELFSAPARGAIETLFQHQQREMDLIKQALRVPQADLLEASHQLQKQMALATEPLREMLDRLKTEQDVIAPWFTQMKSAADYAKTFLESWPEQDALEDEGTNWDALDKHLVGVEAAIQQLPERNATAQQIRAVGLTPVERICLVVALLSLLLQILDYLETCAQGQFSRQQAANETAHREYSNAIESGYRERLISTIEALAERTPDQELIPYVVGPRPAKIKSAISKGLLLGTIHPNQVVLATAHSGRWVKVTYRDHLEERDVEGWVLKHYLIRQAPASADNGG